MVPESDDNDRTGLPWVLSDEHGAYIDGLDTPEKREHGTIELLDAVESSQGTARPPDQAPGCYPDGVLGWPVL